MNGWLELGGYGLRILHQEDGLLWVLPRMQDPRIVVLNLVSGRVLATPWHGTTPQGALSFAGGLLVRAFDARFCRITATETLWERPGTLLDADRDHALVCPDAETLAVLDAEGAEVHRQALGLQDPDELDLDEVLRAVAIAGNRFAIVDLNTLIVRDLAGRELERRRLQGDGFVTRMGRDFVVIEHLRDPEGPRTRFSGAIQAELPGHAQSIAGSPACWVADVVFPDARCEAVFVTDGHIERTPIQAPSVRLWADERTRLVEESGGCTWYTGGRISRLWDPDRAWNGCALWDGFVLAQLGSTLTPVHHGRIQRWTVEDQTRHQVEGVLDGQIENAHPPYLRFSYPGEPVIRGPFFDAWDDSVVFAPAQLDPPAGDEAAQLELLEGALGIALEAWHTADRSWRRDDVLELPIETGPGDHTGAREALAALWATGFVEEPLWQFLSGAFVPGCAALGLVRSGGAADDSFLVPFARGPREEVYAVARWPLTRRFGVAVQRSDETRPRWLCEDVEDFFAQLAQHRLPPPGPAGPEWFRLAHQPDAPTRLELAQNDDAIERERRLVHTPWGWGTPGYAGLSNLTFVLLAEVSQPVDERLNWLRTEVVPLLLASGEAPDALDSFFDTLEARGPLLTAYLEGGHEPMGPMVTGTYDPAAPQWDLRVTRYGLRSRLPGAIPLFRDILLWSWPPVGLVLLANDTENLELLSEHAVRDLPRFGDWERPLRPLWLQELFGEAPPTTALAEAFTAFIRRADDSHTALRQAFEAQGWDLHVQMVEGYASFDPSAEG